MYSRIVSNLQLRLFHSCASLFQAKLPEESFPGSPDKIVHNQNVNVPPATHLIADLEPHSLYAVRVACDSSQGSSDWSPWVEIRTKQGGEATECLRA